MTRRFWLSCVAWSLGWLGTLSASRRVSADQDQPTLNEMLRSQLKCRRPEEFAYVDLVTAKVDSGELPLSMVLSMLKWSRKRAIAEMESRKRKTDIPFPYFQQGLMLRAQEIGVDLPPFNVDIQPQ
jgi:hypothetical protein